jgi:hypothetical protein
MRDNEREEEEENLVSLALLLLTLKNKALFHIDSVVVGQLGADRGLNRGRARNGKRSVLRAVLRATKRVGRAFFCFFEKRTKGEKDLLASSAALRLVRGRLRESESEGKRHRGSHFPTETEQKDRIKKKAGKEEERRLTSIRERDRQCFHTASSRT